MDILSLHQKITESFDIEKENCVKYSERLSTLEKLLTHPDLLNSTRRAIKTTIEKLKETIEDIEVGKTQGFYVMEATELVQQYSEILRMPKKVSFMGAPIVKNAEKSEIIKKYLSTVHKYCPNIDAPRVEPTVGIEVDTCKKCQTGTPVIELDGYYVCTNCGGEENIGAASSSYKDAERVNVGSKYTYDKRIHFRDCMNQFQGKQNSTIPQKVYDAIEREFANHGLLRKSDKKEERFQDITKELVLLFLKETGYSKHYEDAVLIHYNLTGIQPPDISELEARIMSDFDQLVETYELLYKSDDPGSKKIGRKNFINNQYVLYQLLRRHKYPCDITEFSILKTTERKSYHDDICRELFAALGWNFVSVF